MSFTPDRASSQEIEPFQLIQASVSQMPPMLLPLIILATPSLVLTILGVMSPSLENPLAIVDAFVLTPVFSGASIYLVERYLSTRTSDLGGAFTEALEKCVQLIIAFLLYAIAVFVGFFLLILPGFYVAVRLCFFLYAIMIDDLDAVASLKFSWELVGGRWGTVFGSQLLSFLCFVVPVLAISALIGVFLKSKGLSLELIFDLIFGVTGLIVTPFLTLYYTKLYLRLKGSHDDN
jgi:hypothetical protein